MRNPTPHPQASQRNPTPGLSRAASSARGSSCGGGGIGSGGSKVESILKETESCHPTMWMPAAVLNGDSCSASRNNGEGRPRSSPVPRTVEAEPVRTS